MNGMQRDSVVRFRFALAGDNTTSMRFDHLRYFATTSPGRDGLVQPIVPMGCHHTAVRLQNWCGQQVAASCILLMVGQSG